MTRAVNKIAASMKTAKFKLNIQNGVPKGGIAGIVVTVPAICSCFFFVLLFFWLLHGQIWIERFVCAQLVHEAYKQFASNGFRFLDALGCYEHSALGRARPLSRRGYAIKVSDHPATPPITTCLPRSSHHPIWLSSTQRWLRGCDSWALVASIAIAVVVAGHFLCTFDIYLMHHYATVSGNKGTEHFRVEDTVRLRKISALAFVISVSFSFWNMIRKTLN